MSSNWQMPRAGESRRPGSSTQPLRYITRIGMVAIIFVLAWFRGFNNTAMVYLAVVVAWAACLPIFTRGFANWLSARGYSGSTRRTILITVAISLLIVFALTARTVVGSG